MKKVNFNNETLIQILQEKIPEVSDFIFPEFLFSAYIIYGTFGTFLRDQIMKKENNLELIERSFAFLNYLIENGDERVLQMLRVETFEMLTDYDETIETAKKYLNDNALQIFLGVIKLIKG